MDELIPIVAIFFTIGVPAMALAAHLVLRPMIKDVTAAIHSAKGTASEDFQERLARIEHAVLEQSRQLEELSEAESFRRQIEAGKG